MTRFISRRNTITPGALKRCSRGTVVFHHNGNYEDVRFVRVHGGWTRERVDVTSESVVVTSAAVAAECNMAFGYKDSWAEVY